MKEKEIKELISIATHNAEKYHLIKPIVDKINEGAQFRYWLLVLDLTIEEQKQTFQSIRAGDVGIISEYAYIVHDKDVKEDGTPVRVHVHMFIYTRKSLRYLTFLKQTGLTPITAIPTTEQNKEGWLEYVTNHKEGKHVYDVHDVQFSSEAFKSSFFQSNKGMKGMMTKEKIDLIRKTIAPVFEEHKNAYISQTEINNKLAEDYVTADIFNYPTIYRNFVEIPLQEHNRRYAEKPPAYDYDLLIDDIRKGRIPLVLAQTLQNLFETGEVPMEQIAMLEHKEVKPDFMKVQITLPAYKPPVPPVSDEEEFLLDVDF